MRKIVFFLLLFLLHLLVLHLLVLVLVNVVNQVEDYNMGPIFIILVDFQVFFFLYS